MQKKQNTSLVWFRNDLRIHDNSSLANAIKSNNRVIALYCFDPRQFEVDQLGFKKTEKYRAKFLIDTVTDLKSNLAQLNIPLFVYTIKPENCIPDLVENYKVNHIFLQEEWTQEEVNVFSKVKENLPEHIQISTNYNQFLYHPEDIPFSIEQLPKVFTEFRKACEKRSEIRQETSSSTEKVNKESIENLTSIPSLSDLGFDDFEVHPNSAFSFKGGETEALKRLEDYFFNTKKLGVYKKTRNGLIGKDFSSKFSPWLANGSISAKHIYYQVKQFEKTHFKNDSTYWLIFELIWRDYFKYVSLKFGNQIFKIDGILNKDYQWSKNQQKINDWINGKTPEPFVNANMIELKKTGWMSNRGRQNVASYFAKSMELDWRIGAAYFESLLLDYDVHSNYGNWMYVAGVGNDPRDRKFNVKLQANRYDSNCKYQRLWLQDTLF
ncbi:Deoxyribodipyrimidine photolyase, single-strand-specific [Mesoflavibacter sp. HG96]|uniref:Cryptochrome DASH n=1 Tax=Mesoflavibacter profundi TaxID=2708110 RepID=A0ABT4RYM3_9FLAO|nr:MULTISPECIES: DASH family cryptochrome [Mesoflavibacter]MDA0176917.1 DASH family cryptochrome [Mesoflavibacter profundi]QIJ87832.1 Deoxyribodipyrimidine photolyase, single-strand-specific [Mesoflavibacter sp. HG96]QIJ90560.1 Deoxyribodipyrimidine photolyase, single-strand-specific [Mesoflavibacter sp. HG37]